MLIGVVPKHRASFCKRFKIALWSIFNHWATVSFEHFCEFFFFDIYYEEGPSKWSRRNRNWARLAEAMNAIHNFNLLACIFAFIVKKTVKLFRIFFLQKKFCSVKCYLSNERKSEIFLTTLYEI